MYLSHSGSLNSAARASSAVLSVLVDPDVHVGVDVAGLAGQPGERLAEMALLRREPVLFVERHLLAQRARTQSIGPMIDQHAAFPRVTGQDVTGRAPGAEPAAAHAALAACGRPRPSPRGEGRARSAGVGRSRRLDGDLSPPGRFAATLPSRGGMRPPLSLANQSNQSDLALLQPHHHAVGRALGVDHGETDEARPVGIDEQRAAVGARGGAAAPFTSTVSGPTPPAIFKATGSGLPSDSASSTPRAVGRIDDAKRRRAVVARQPRRSGGNALQRRRQFRGRGEQRALRRRLAAARCPARCAQRRRTGSAPRRRGRSAPAPARRPGRPTQTPMVRLPSKPTDQASR